MSILHYIASVIVIIGAVIFIIGVVIILFTLHKRPYQQDVAPVKGSPLLGILYSFTMGMNPFTKESARLHWLAYLRGVIFHLCIFAIVAFLIISPWFQIIEPAWHIVISAIFTIGAILSLAGIVIRQLDSKLRHISTPDDYFALIIVTVFLASGAVATIYRDFLPLFWIISGIIMAYAPFGKLRHFIYFFYERIFLGQIYGRRGLLEWKHE